MWKLPSTDHRRQNSCVMAAFRYHGKHWRITGRGMFTRSKQSWSLSKSCLVMDLVYSIILATSSNQGHSSSINCLKSWQNWGRKPATDTPVRIASKPARMLNALRKLPCYTKTWDHKRARSETNIIQQLGWCSVKLKKQLFLLLIFRCILLRQRPVN